MSNKLPSKLIPVHTATAMLALVELAEEWVMQDAERLAIEHE